MCTCGSSCTMAVSALEHEGSILTFPICLLLQQKMQGRL
jgi:hypothetical protein